MRVQTLLFHTCNCGKRTGERLGAVSVCYLAYGRSIGGGIVFCHAI
jgi:hypothetical protein